MIPRNVTDAVGVEMRAPNSSWETHAQLLLDSVIVLP
jgi:hypothetical protein